MPVLDFTPDEQYIIHLIKSPKDSRFSATYMWGYMSGAALLAVCGVYYESISVLAIAFIVLIGYRVNEEYYQKRWVPVWRSIILKYEAALETTMESHESEP